MKLLLVGASGFIGKNFLELAPEGIEITGIYNKSKDIVDFARKKRPNTKLFQCDLTKNEDVKKLLNRIGKNFDHCIYLAGNVDVPLSKQNPAEDLTKTTLGLINFLQSCNKIKRFIYMSTAGVYDGNEGFVDAKTKLNPTVPYCISKMASEQYVKFYHSAGKIEQFVILRFGGAFGLYSRKSKFMTKLVDDILQGMETIEIYGDGSNIINVMYTKDVIRALIVCLKSKVSNVVCNLGQDNMTIKETVERTAKALGKKVRIKYTPKMEMQKYIDFKTKTDFNGIFGFKPAYSFDEGIKEFSKTLKNEK